MNKFQATSRSSVKQVPIKEKTVRERALEFAKNNIPKPRQRRDTEI
jgi:hypothetical protein